MTTYAHAAGLRADTADEVSAVARHAVGEEATVREADGEHGVAVDRGAGGDGVDDVAAEANVVDA